MSTRTLLKEIFTEDEWNAIYDAMADYQDHGETETDLSQSVQSKITELFSWNQTTPTWTTLSKWDTMSQTVGVLHLQ